MKYLRLTAASLAAAIALCSCGNKSVVKSQTQQTIISLSWWGNDARNEYTIAAVEQFQELHPEIKVKISYSEWSGYESRSRVQMISDTEADVMQINFAWLSQYSPDGEGYYDLEKLTNRLDLSFFSKSMLEYGRVNGILNAVPIAMNCQTVYVNKTVYDQYGIDIPQTWDDLFDAAKVMSKDGVYAMSAGSKSMWMYALSYAEQYSGKSFIDEEGKLGFGKDEVKVMIQLYCDLVQNDVIPQVEFYDRMNIDTGVYAGTVAWVSDAMNYCGNAIENGYEMIPADYTAIEPEKSGIGWHAKPATMYAISKNTEHPEEAAMLLDFLLNSKEMALQQGVEKGIPLSFAARDYLEAEGMLTGLQYDASLKMEKNHNLGRLDPFVENSTIIDQYVEACNLVLYDKADITEAAEGLFEQIKEAAQ